MPEFPTREEPAPPSTKTISWLLVLSVVFGFAVSFCFMLLSFLFPDEPTAGKLVIRLGLLFGTLAFIGPPVFYFLHKRADAMSIFRLRKVPGNALWASAVLAVGLVVLTDGLDRMVAPSINEFLDSTIGTLSPELKADYILERLKEELLIHDWFTGLVLIIAAVAAAGICEEMLIRGMFQKSLERTMHAASAIGLSSIVFAVMHFNPWAMIQIFALAVVLGIIAWYARSIFPTMVIHGVNNFIAILFVNLGEESLRWYGTENSVHSVVLAMGGVLTTVGIVWLVSSLKEKHHS
ncbi:MAG: CPBP family intramembrane metalloprotease [Bacteroidetes bacterium]|nr:CPBP family intramembrane metalloprotease [Bacteroidota bacterium]